MKVSVSTFTPLVQQFAGWAGVVGNFIITQVSFLFFLSSVISAHMGGKPPLRRILIFYLFQKHFGLKVLLLVIQFIAHAA